MNSSLDNYQPSTHFSIFPPAVKNLLVITAIVFFAEKAPVIGPFIRQYGPLYAFHSPNFYPWQFITYLFLHANLGHIFFNLFALWMFGQAVENYLGTKRFLIYFFVCGIGGGLAFILINANPILTRQGLVYASTIGNSGAVFGLLAAFGLLFPEQRIYLWFLVPIKAKYFVIAFGALELYFGVSGTEAGVAHWAHIGGAVVGAVLILLFKKWGGNRKQALF